MSNSQADYYHVLGVTPETAPEDIKKAFRQLARDVHPDGAHPNPERFREAQAAWDVLGDPKEKAAYDRGRLPASPEGQRQQNDISSLFYTNVNPTLWKQQPAEVPIIIPVNDLALLQGLITANLVNNSGKTGKWDIKKNPKDTRDFVNETLYKISIEDGEIHVWRNVVDWMRDRTDEHLRTKDAERAGKDGPPKNKRDYFHEFYLSDQPGRSLFRNINIPFNFDNYLQELKSLAGKIANNTRKKHKPDEYDIDREMKTIYDYAHGLRFTTEENSARHPENEIALRIPPKDFFAELARTNDLVIEIKPRSPEGQQASGEKKG